MRMVDATLRDRLLTLVTSMGYELVGVELLPQGQQAILRIYLDCPKGVTVEDCSLVSRQVSAMLDVEELVPGRYTLEVSSPGIDRPLFELSHFQQFVGRQVKIRLGAPINGRRQYKGLIKRVENDNIHVLLDEIGQEVILPFAAIEKANLIGDIRL